MLHPELLKSTISRYSNFSVQIQIKPKSQFEILLRDTEESEFFDLVDFRDVAFPVETVTQSGGSDTERERVRARARERGRERNLCYGAVMTTLYKSRIHEGAFAKDHVREPTSR